MQTKDIEEYLSNLARAGSSYSSVRRTSYALKNFFLFLVHQGAMKNNPAYALRVTPAHSDVLSTDQIVSIFHYLHRRQASTEQGETVRHQRDDLILFLMIFYGVRQNQVCALKLSTLEANDKSVSLIISTLSTLRLHAQVLRKLRSYLQSRKSNSDVIFLDALGKKPLDYWSIRHSLNDLSQALQLDCSPKALYHTFLSLQQHQEIREPLISKVLSIGTTLKHGAIPNA
jgi:site-specific recombinase XerD